MGKKGLNSFSAFLLQFLLLTGAGWGLLFAAENTEAQITYYGETGCSHCDTFAEKTVPQLEKKYGTEIELRQYDILDPAVYEECGRMLSSLGYEFRYFPVVVIGNNIYQGETEISAWLEDEIRHYRGSGAYLPEKKTRERGNQAVSDRGKAIFHPESTALVFAAGVVDGINPCAFTVILFFFSYLTLRRKNHTDFLVAGAIFIAAVFLSYILIGCGFLSILDGLSGVSAVRLAVKIAATLLTAFFAAASLSDFFRMRKGDCRDTMLKLPGFLGKRIHESVRKGVSGAWLFFSVFLTGMAVSLLELACTGQIYFPAIVYVIESGESGSGLLLLLVYNTGFVLPLFAVYLLLAAGMKSGTISAWFRDRLYLAKLALFAVFAVLSVGIWVM